MRKGAEIQVGTEDNQIENYEVTSHGQVVIIEMEIHNVSESPVTIDEDFYYLFGIKHTEEAEPGGHTGRMDLALFPFDVFTGDLATGESVDTSLVVYIGPGEINALVYEPEGADENEVTWEIVEAHIIKTTHHFKEAVAKTAFFEQ